MQKTVIVSGNDTVELISIVGSNMLFQSVAFIFLILMLTHVSRHYQYRLIKSSVELVLYALFTHREW